jgi:hypothetical protein
LENRKHELGKRKLAQRFIKTVAAAKIIDEIQQACALR